MAAQKLRTPEGLDWIRSVVSAADSDVKFIVTDHPVTVYNAQINPESPDCAYPQDPMVASLGTQTVFAMDADTCLILTHLEYSQKPDRQDLKRLRTNARHHGTGMMRTDAFIRDRRLSPDEVIAINHLLKSRAKRCIAAANKDWLYPERHFSGSWSQIAKVLLPKSDLWHFGGRSMSATRTAAQGTGTSMAAGRRPTSS